MCTRLHKAGYFRELLATNPDISEDLRSLPRLCRETVMRLQKTESALVRSLERDSLLTDRVKRLMTIPAVGLITALIWELEIGDRETLFFDQKGDQLLRAVRRRVPAIRCNAHRCPNNATNICRLS